MIQVSEQGDRVHIVRRWPCGGGMEDVVKHHLARGEWLVALTGEPDGRSAVRNLGLLPGTTLGEASRRLDSVLSGFCGADFLFYNGCALEWLHTRKPGNRYFVYLHSDYPCLENWLERIIPYTDGFFCVNPIISERISRVVGEKGLPVYTLSLPVEFPRVLMEGATYERGSRSPIIIGYSGRMEVAQKRLDRLGSFVWELDRLGLNYKLELLGAGSYLESLQEDLGGNPRVEFYGHLEGDAYWLVLSRWKYVLFLSDYEGLPLSLLEAVFCGAVPVYPDFHGGKDWISALGDGFLYPVGDTWAAAQRIHAKERDWGDSEWKAYRETAQRRLHAHDVPRYFAAMKSALCESSERKGEIRRSYLDLPRWCPFWVYNRLRRFRLLGSFREKGFKK